MTNTNTLLLVDDEPLVIELLAEGLTEAGYVVTMARSGREALALLDADGAAYAGLITDIRLGEGPNGWEVARRARTHAAVIPVVYMTADSAGERAAQGVTDSLLLQKPFAIADLVSALTTLIAA